VAVADTGWRRWRALGFGGGGTRADRTAKERFEELTFDAAAAGVAWRDLVGEAYRAPGDRSAGGLTVHVDWAWRADELERRLRMQRDET
jgi:hypothetical protein